MTDHVERLLADWVRLVVELEPHNVLDVGCGKGRVLELLRGRGIEVCGVEESAERVRELETRRLPARKGTALALPFENASFDVVCLRHVLHHLADHEGALREARRVARRALLVAEPCYDTSLPSQAAGDRLDRWHKERHDGSDGSVHRSNLDLGTLVEAIRRVAPDAALETGRYLPLTPWTAEEVEERFGLFAAKLSTTARERAAYAELLEIARAGMMTRGGSIWVRVQL